MGTRRTTPLRRPSTTKSETVPVAEAPKRRNGSVSKTVLEYGMQYPGQLLHVNQISQETGLEASQVRAAIRNMMAPGAPAGLGTWEVALRGNAWTYHPAKPAGTENFMMIEVLAELPEGLLVRTNSGQVGLLKPVSL